RIERAWATSFGKRTLPGRLIDYLSFYVGACCALMTLPRHDIVMALTTPPLIGLVAVIAGRIRGMRTVALVQDIYPDVAVALGALKRNSLLTRLLDRLNRYILRHSDRIVVLGDCMRRRIVEKLGDAAVERIDVIHNWADGDEISPIGSAKNGFVTENNLESRFVVMFSGNFGHINDFQTVMSAAREMRDRPDVLFLFIGEGGKEKELKDFAASNGLGNIRFMPYQAREVTPLSLAAGHAMLVTLADGLAGLSVPSKTYPIMAAGRPLLFVGDQNSEAAKIARNGCGAAVASGDARGLVSVISDWAADRSKPDALGRHAREIFENRFERKHAVSSYISMFHMCLVPEERVGISKPESPSKITSPEKAG
ncbi:MAG: glycosyltransferase family 4 protein, partial [Blastocatellia bacterium]